MSGPQVLLEGLVFPESPRWRDGRLWLSDWGAREILAVDVAGSRETIVAAPSFPCCIDFLRDGRLLLVSSDEGRVLRRDGDGALVTHADVSELGDPPWNEVIADRRDHLYVNNTGFDFAGGAAPAPGSIVLITEDGSARLVADGIEFPNGMAITPDGATLIVAESFGNRLSAFTVTDAGGLTERRIWADLGDGVPDGICLDAAGAVWYADVPNRRCVRVQEGGRVTHTVEVDRGCFSCALGGPEGRSLFIAANQWAGLSAIGDGARGGQILTTAAPAPGAGKH